MIKNHINNIITNWKTSSAGVTILVLSIYNISTSWRVYDGNAWADAVMKVAAGLALLYAADTNTPPPPTAPKP